MIISYMNSWSVWSFHSYVYEFLYISYMKIYKNSYMNSCNLWIHMIFSYMNSYVSWIHIWIRVYQGSRWARADDSTGSLVHCQPWKTGACPRIVEHVSRAWQCTRRRSLRALEWNAELRKIQVPSRRQLSLYLRSLPLAVYSVQAM